MTNGTAVTQEGAALLKTRLLQLAPRMLDVLPKHITPERMLRLALITYNRQPDLQKCSVESIVEAVLIISAWGLEIGRTAHIVPFGNKATAIADYKGKIELAIKGGTVRSVDARVVRAGDDFYHEYGLNEQLVHRPSAKGGKIIGAYAIARLTVGGNHWEYMTVEELEGIRKLSKMAGGPAWTKHVGEMYKKTVTHRVLKTVPWSQEMAQAYENEQVVEFGDDEEPIAHAVPGTPVRIAAGGRSAGVANGELGGEEVPSDAELDREIAERER